MTPDAERAGVVRIRDGRIVDVVDPAAVPAGTPVEDLGDSVLLPGLVDSHVHVNEPGRTEWEGFESATRAAAAGGVTTLVDMPLNSSPVTTTRDALLRKLDAAEGHGHVDCAFWGGLVPEGATALEPLLDAGARGVKAFLCHSGIDDFPAAGESDLRAALPILAERGLPLLVHAELATDSRPPAGDPRRYATYLASRPPSWEREAVALLLRLCRELRAPIHVVHLSAAAAARLVAEARREGLPLTAETCPHYLALAAEEIEDGRTEFKCAPPVRERANRDALWDALLDGTIGLVVSDHSPCPPLLKEPEHGDFMAAWGGIASLQLSLPVVWTEARRRGVPLSRLAAWMAEAPARLAGLASHKGRIAPGYDADLVAFDPDATFEVEGAGIHHRHKLTPYLGRTLHGVVRKTWLRGRPVFSEGSFEGAPRGALLQVSHGQH
ncbi:MAG TPA: allantoinase AllB [Vicinamibacteria bacterium]|nr:allantoinase AllB [Vicinamibacteria bacterium]